MAAHNEEKIIRGALENLSKLPFDSYEVLLGLDGCSDNTLPIVQEYAKKQPTIFHYFELNERKGKPAVINKIFPHAKGEIIVIHDADWIFRAKSKEDMHTFVSWFEDPNLGGIAESYPVEYDPTLLQSKDLAFLSIAWGNYFWLEFMKKNFSILKENILYVNPSSKNFPFLCNTFRKELYNFNETLADDFERSLDILQKGYSLRILDHPTQPRLIAGYSYQTFKDAKKQKSRTALAREQLYSKYHLKITPFNFYIPLFFYAFTHMWKKGPKVVIATSSWILLTAYGSVKHKLSFKKKSTKEGWLLRAQRQ